jgi:pimeloyl-ACP methyl ester carboxylesterase
VRWLLLRGLVREHRHWLDFPDFFRANVRGPDGAPVEVLQLDLPGFGDQTDTPVPPSVPEFVTNVRARLKAQLKDADEKIGIFAVSLGGMVTLSWLEQFPGDFHCGVVINTSAGDLSPPWERFRMHNWHRVFAAPFMKPLPRERMILQMTRHQGDLDKDAARYAAIATDTPPRPKNAYAQLRAATRSKTPKHLEVPCLVMASVGDHLVSHRCSEKIAARLQMPLRLHRGVGIEAAGHDLPLDQPSWVCAELQRWLDEGCPTQQGDDRPAA